MDRNILHFVMQLWQFGAQLDQWQAEFQPMEALMEEKL
jgi:hypothetical protein